MYATSSGGAPAAAGGRRIAVALHDIEPATFERCALIRDWLDDHGVDRVTLLVIPARDLHPLGERGPAMAGWLSERRRLGDAIAQHGFQHDQPAAALPRRVLRHPSRPVNGEFVGLSDAETRRALDAGWRVLKLAGLDPEGFVAPALRLHARAAAAAPAQGSLVGDAAALAPRLGHARVEPLSGARARVGNRSGKPPPARALPRAGNRDHQQSGEHGLEPRALLIK